MKLEKTGASETANELRWRQPVPSKLEEDQADARNVPRATPGILLPGPRMILCRLSYVYPS